MTQSYIKKQLSDLLSSALVTAFPTLLDVTPEVTVSQLPGVDYQCNSAMKLGKQLQLSPRDVATRWCAALPQNTLLEKVDIAGPGFINLCLSSDALVSDLHKMSADSLLGVASTDFQSQRIIVEFSSPNTAKQMHVGHLRSTIIGDCLARVFEFLKADVLRLNHVGDWGTAFGMLIAYLKKTQPDVLAGKKKADLTELAAWYVAAKKIFDVDDAFKKQAQQEVVALQSGASDSFQAWRLICDISRENYQEIYDLLNVRLNERGESFYNPMLADTVADLTQKGWVKISDGAKCIFLEGFVTREGDPLPMMIQKSDGGYNYTSTDLAAMRHRVETEKADRIIVLTDAGQALHFSMLVKLSVKAGYLERDGKNIRFDHVPFGLVLGDDGKKIKTRAGDTEPLINLILTAIEEAEKIVAVRTKDFTPEEQKNLAKILGVNAIKYADLSCHRVSDYKFSYERMLRFEGNTAAFLMYSYVRILSIERKIGSKTYTDQTVTLLHPSERALALQLVQFDDVIFQVAEELLPHRLCEYLYHLAESFNAFFRDCRVEGVQEEYSRLFLCQLTGRVLEQGMKLLGLKTVDRM